MISIDNIVLDSQIASPKDVDEIFRTLHHLDGAVTNIAYWEVRHIGRFRNNFRFSTVNGASFWAGIGLNGPNGVDRRLRLDFNPNKTANQLGAKQILELCHFHCKRMHTEIRRFDVAIDIPCEREACFLQKDHRVYVERRHSRRGEWTQYLGAKASHVGRVKLYNKAAEARLPYPLTRLEITLSPALTYEEIPFPTVYYFNANRQISIAERLSHTDRYILDAILQGVGTPKDLGRRMGQKMSKMIEHYVQRVVLLRAEYEALRRQLSEYQSLGLK